MTKPSHNFVGRCAHCGGTFSAYSPPCRPRKYCSAECGSKVALGSKQSADHLAKRIKSGAAHPNWLGDEIKERTGRCRAARIHREVPSICEVCASTNRLERHHVDGNTRNNDRSNIQFLCRKCHMTADGRINRMREVRYGIARS